MRTMKNDELSTYIKSVRQQLNDTQAEFAARIDSNRANIANYEKGRAIPPGDVLLKIQRLEASVRLLKP